MQIYIKSFHFLKIICKYVPISNNLYNKSNLVYINFYLKKKCFFFKSMRILGWS